LKVDLEGFYDNYRSRQKDEADDYRLNLIVEKITSGEKVLEVGGHIGLLSKRMQDKGAQVTLTDISGVALDRARKRGVKETVHIDLDVESLPYADNTFDAVVSSSSIEHVFYPQKMIKESARVLKNGGEFILLAPNIGHWMCRLLLLLGRFPYIENTPTDELHIRFLTLAEAKRMCAQEGLRPESVDGNAGLWVHGLYPSVFRLKYIHGLYRILSRKFPSLFARDFILVCRK
jgi:ubiquinone/menaquinone biosynthesis C-methylase UbiE